MQEKREQWRTFLPKLAKPWQILLANWVNDKILSVDAVKSKRILDVSEVESNCKFNAPKDFSH